MAVPFTDMDTAVRSKYIPTLIEQIFIAHPFLTRILSKNKVIFDSGANIRQPVIYGRLKGGSYSGMDPFDITLTETQTMAQWGMETVL